MDRGEPSLVPEWLKGTSGSGGSGTSHHSLSGSQSDDSGATFSARYRPLLQVQLSAAGHSDYDSPRYSALIDRTSTSSPRRAPSNNGGVSDRSTYDRDVFLHPRGYSNFSRNSSFRGYDPTERERDVQRVEKDRDWERELEFRDRERLFGADYRDRDRERSDSHQWSSTALASKYETDATLRRSQSMIANRRVENGIKKTGNESGSVTAPLVGGSLASNMQKAAFERNFPSLGAEERQGNAQSNLPNASFFNSTTTRASSPGLAITTGSTQGVLVSGASVIGADGWSSALADAPVLNGSNNGLFTSVQQIAPGNSVSSMMPGPASSSGLNMAEALVQSPARVRTPPQLSIEAQRLEELALKQSRQLIPMTPSMPKTMGLGTSEKLKPKMPRSIDSLASAVKVGQPIGSTPVLNSPLRVPARPEALKLPQGGKLLVLKSAREKNGVQMSVKSDSLSPTKGVNTGNTSLGLSTGGIGGNSGLLASRKPKLLPDRKAIPISSLPVSTGLDSGTAQRSKDSILVLEEKRPLSQAQNRNDFFNALRRKASGSSSVSDIQEKSSLSVEQKADERNIKDILNCEDRVDVKENGSVDSIAENADNTAFSVEATCGLKNNPSTTNGIILGEIHATVKDNSETLSSASMNKGSVMGGSEEEEAAFLRSLGWEENTGEEEALTEEEINAFYQEHMKVMPATPAFRPGSHRLHNAAVEMPVGSLGSMSSGISSSDSEPDGESYA